MKQFEYSVDLKCNIEQKSKEGTIYKNFIEGTFNSNKSLNFLELSISHLLENQPTLIQLSRKNSSHP